MSYGRMQMWTLRLSMPPSVHWIGVNILHNCQRQPQISAYRPNHTARHIIAGLTVITGTTTLF